MTSQRRHGARRAARFIEAHEDEAPTILGRAGLASRVVIYLVIAVLLFEVAVGGHATAQADAQGALFEVARQPAGPALVATLALGLAAYAAWRLQQALRGTTRDEGIWQRLGAAAIGLLYVVLAIEAVRLLWSSSQSASSAQPVVASVLRWPAGSVVLGTVACLLGIGGLGFIVWGFRRDLSGVIDRRRAGERWWRAARMTTCLGDLGRGAVVCLVAAALFLAASEDAPTKARSIDQLLASLRGSTGGPEAIAALGVTFLAVAAFSCIEIVWGRY